MGLRQGCVIYRRPLLQHIQASECWYVIACARTHGGRRRRADKPEVTASGPTRLHTRNRPQAMAPPRQNCNFKCLQEPRHPLLNSSVPSVSRFHWATEPGYFLKSRSLEYFLRPDLGHLIGPCPTKTPFKHKFTIPKITPRLLLSELRDRRCHERNFGCHRGIWL